MDVKDQEVVTFPDYEAEKIHLNNELVPTKSLVITSKKEAKAVRTDLNKLEKEVNERKKFIKSSYLAQLAPMESQAKELIAMIDEVKAPIDEQIKAYESEEKAVREIALNDLLAEMSESYHIDPSAVDIKSKWLTGSVWMMLASNELKPSLDLQKEIADELTLMVRYGKGALPKGIIRKGDHLINEEGEEVFRRPAIVTATKQQLEELVSYCSMAGINIATNWEAD